VLKFLLASLIPLDTISFLSLISYKSNVESYYTFCSVLIIGVRLQPHKILNSLNFAVHIFCHDNLKTEFLNSQI